MLARALRLGVALALVAGSLHAQTVEDGLMMAKGEFLTGNLYAHDSWDQYWEGTLKRDNGNVGEVTTRSTTWYGNYGLTDRLNLIGAVPYIWTKASQGVLHGSQGFQDLALAAKYRVFQTARPGFGTLRAFAVASTAIPMTHYNNELLPLSIGTRNAQVSGRGTLNYQSEPGWFVNGTVAYHVRFDTRLDRPYYFTTNEFVLSDRVDMPNATEHAVSGGLMTRRLMVAGFLARMVTLGGGDIRRQDMPFVSNRMNSTRAGAMAMLPLPFHPSLQVQLSATRTVSGRNVGESTTMTAGILYRFNRRVTP
jgi:hypothetical protein